MGEISNAFGIAEDLPPIVLISDGPRTLVIADGEPQLWVVRETSHSLGARGIIEHGTITVPARPQGQDHEQLPFNVVLGMSTAPMTVTSPGQHTRYIAANELWAVPNSREWHCTVESRADLRLVTLDETVAPNSRHNDTCLLLGSAEGPQVVRAFLRLVTPAWIDSETRCVDDLAQAELDTLTAVQPAAGSQNSQTAAAFAMVLNWSLGRVKSHHGADPQLDAALDYIEQNLADPQLATENLAHALHISRRALQQMFKPHGGVATYIRARRVEAAVDLLTDPNEIPDVDLIAKITGLGSRRTLERAVQRAYSLTPYQLRAQAGHNDPRQP